MASASALTQGDKELTVTPRSADSVLVLGQADSYAQCSALRRDGARCSAFVVRGRGNGVCESHLQMAIAGGQRSRMEFASGCVLLLSLLTSSTTTLTDSQPPQRPFGQRQSRRIHARPDLSALNVEGTSLARDTYVISGPRELRSLADPSSITYDVSARYGRGRAEKEQRKRKHEEQAQLASELLQQRPEQRPRRIESRCAKSAPSEALTTPDDIDRKFLDEADQNSIASQTLRVAQATLRGDPKPMAALRGQNTMVASRPAPNASTTRVSFVVMQLTQLLARHTAEPGSLPQAKLKGTGFRSNVLEREGPAARHVEMLKVTQYEPDDDLLIVDKPS